MNITYKKKKSNKYKLISKLLSNKVLIVKAFCDKPIKMKQTSSISLKDKKRKKKKRKKEKENGK